MGCKYFTSYNSICRPERCHNHCFSLYCFRWLYFFEFVHMNIEVIFHSQENWGHLPFFWVLSVFGTLGTQNDNKFLYKFLFSHFEIYSLSIIPYSLSIHKFFIVSTPTLPNILQYFVIFRKSKIDNYLLNDYLIWFQR